jgi:hypothetical protein
MNMVETVARAIQTADEQNGGWPYERVILEKHARNDLFDRARAAIEAMRTPTTEMVIAGGEQQMISNIYERMIDAALQEE